MYIYWLIINFFHNASVEKLRTDSDLMLEKAKTRIRQKAAVQDYQRELAAEQPAAAV